MTTKREALSIVHGHVLDSEISVHCLQAVNIVGDTNLAYALGMLVATPYTYKTLFRERENNVIKILEALNE